MRTKWLGLLAALSLVFAALGGTMAFAQGGAEEGGAPQARVSDLGAMVDIMDEGRLFCTAGAARDGSKIALPAGGLPMVTSTVFSEDTAVEFTARFADVDQTKTGGWVMAVILRDQNPNGSYHFSPTTNTPLRGYMILFDHTAVSASVQYGSATGDANIVNGTSGSLTKTAGEGTFDPDAFWAQENTFRFEVMTEATQTSVVVKVNGTTVLEAADVDGVLAGNRLKRPGGWTLYTHGDDGGNRLSAELTELQAGYGGRSAYQSVLTDMRDLLSDAHRGEVQVLNGAQVSAAGVDFGPQGNPSIALAEPRLDFSVAFDYRADKGAAAESWIFILTLRDPNPTLAPWNGDRKGEQGYSVEASRDQISVNHRDGTAAAPVAGAQYALPISDPQRQAFWEHDHHFRVTVKEEAEGTAIAVEADGALLVSALDTVNRESKAGGLSLIAEAGNYAVSLGGLWVSESHTETVDFAEVEDEALAVAGTPVDLIAGRSKYLTLEHADWQESVGGLTFPATGIPRAFTRPQTTAEDTELHLTFQKTAGGQEDWNMMMFLRDQQPGLASWNRADAQGDASAYYLLMAKNVIGVKYVDKAGESTLTDGEAAILSADFWEREHEMTVRVKTLGEGVKIQVVMDGKLILSALDADKKIAKAGGIGILTQGRKDGSADQTFVVDVTVLSANVPEIIDESDDIPEVQDEVLQISGEAVDLVEKRNVYLSGVPYDKQKGAFAFPDSGTPMLVANAAAAQEDLLLTMTLERTSGNLKDWQMMIFVRDQAPGMTSWNRREVTEGSGAAYYFVFQPTGIELCYVDKTMATGKALAGGTTVIPSEIFWKQSHEIRVLVKTLTDGSVKLQLLIDGRLVLSAADASDTKIAAAGGLSLLTHGRSAAGAFSTFSLTAMSANLPILSEFGSDTEQVDFTALVADPAQLSGSALSSASKTWITPNGVRMEKYDIRNVYAKAPQLENFTLKFKAKIEWTGAKDWGGLLTFRDDSANVMPWDTMHRNCYTLMWGYNAADDSTNLLIWRYDTDPDTGARKNAILASCTGLSDNNVEHDYELVCADVAGGVRIVVKCDGEILLDVTDSERPVYGAGSISVVNGSGCNTTFTGMSEGPERADILFGGGEQGGSGLLPPIDNPDYNIGGLDGLAPSVSDPEGGSLGLVVGLSVGGGVLVLGGGAAAFFLLRKRRRA